MTKKEKCLTKRSFFVSVIIIFFCCFISLFKYPYYYSLIFKETGKTDKDTNILSLNLI